MGCRGIVAGLRQEQDEPELPEQPRSPVANNLSDLTKRLETVGMQRDYVSWQFRAATLLVQ
jgi:hypothetical protein